ncbi:MAG TPA: DUF3108 domain-containing protein [Rhodanobacteraceae bacterium]
MKSWSFFPTLLCLLPVAALAASPQIVTAPAPFTATYQVLRKGSPLGTSTLTLTRNTDGTWTFRSRMKAEHGLAAMLGGRVDIMSTFRQHADRIESLHYVYELHTAFSNKQRDVTVNWQANTVDVHTSKGRNFHYPPQPGLVDPNTLVLALGRAVIAGQTQITLPVATKDNVQQQTFVVRDKQTLTVPAGSFTTVRVDRTHDNKGYSAWFDPARFGAVPVKITKQSDGDLTLLLESFRR